MGEIQALKVEAVHLGYVEVNYSWGRTKYGLKEPKMGSYRSIPIPSRTSQYLQNLIQQNEFNSPEDFLFYDENRDIPIKNEDISKVLYNALEGIGIKHKHKKGTDRKITFHSWRILFNTLMRGNVSDTKLRLMTGHKSPAMTDHYTKFNISDFEDVKAVQDKIFS